MGVYYSSVSAQTRKIYGFEIAFTNFYGKAPTMNMGETSLSRWERFLTNAENSVDRLRLKNPNIEFVASCSASEVGKRESFDIAKWNGRRVLSDDFWEKNVVARAIRNDKEKFEIVWLEMV